MNKAMNFLLSKEDYKVDNPFIKVDLDLYKLQLSNSETNKGWVSTGLKHKFENTFVSNRQSEVYQPFEDQKFNVFNNFSYKFKNFI